MFYSYFKTLVGKPVVVELKNDLAVEGTLVSVDQYLNIKLEHTRVTDEARYPHMRSVRNCFIRGSVVRYVQLPKDAVDVDILHDATRREATDRRRRVPTTRSRGRPRGRDGRGNRTRARRARNIYRYIYVDDVNHTLSLIIVAYPYCTYETPMCMYTRKGNVV